MRGQHDSGAGDGGAAGSSGGLPLAHAIALGALHGPAELLPVSSSAHIALIPPLLGWPYAELPPSVRKSFEVCLHAGTLAALATLVPRPPLRLIVLGTLPAAIAGLTLERPIEERLGGPRVTAAGLIVGSALLVAADASTDPAHPARRADEVTKADALALGVAQALALIPGLSRTGLAVAVARARGFGPHASFTLARQAALPVIAGAAALKGSRLARDGLARELRAPFAAGAAAALVSTLVAAPLRRVTAVRPVAAERVALAAAALVRLRRCRG